MDYDKLYKEARQVAIKAHGNQAYDIFPYEKHLDDVVQVLKRFGLAGDFILAGYLHDTVEDGALSYSKIKDAFNVNVAEMVYCCTDELGRNRKERKAKTYPKIKANANALIIKLADRIANVEHSFRMNKKSEHHKMYRDEYQDFKDNLYDEKHSDIIQTMWKRLDELLLAK